MNLLRKVDPATAQTILSLAQSVGMRNVISHGYAVIDHAKVWVAVSRNVPALAARLSELAAAAPPP